jgi:hypothetical protein
MSQGYFHPDPDVARAAASGNFDDSPSRLGEKIAKYQNTSRIASRGTFMIIRATVIKATPRRQAATTMIREAMPAATSLTSESSRSRNPACAICVPGTPKHIF